MFNIKRVSIIALLLLVVGGIGIAFTFNTENKSGNWSIQEETINSEEVMNIKVETDNLEIVILPTKEESIKLELEADHSQYDLITSIEGATLSIQANHKRIKLFNFDLFSFGSALTIHVPEKAYDSLQVENDNGRITLANLEVNNINAATDNGRIELNNIISSMTVVKTSNGKIILDQVAGEVNGTTSNGSITFTTEHLDQRVDLKTNNGKIDLHTENEPTNVTFDVRVDNGTVRIFGESNWDTVIGKGDHLIKLETNNGKITVTK